MIWLRELIKTGRPELIATAREEATSIKTPLTELEKRFCRYLVATHGNSMAGLASFGFGDLDALERRVACDMQRQEEALARFGCREAVLADMPAETFAREALRGLRRRKSGFFDPSQVEKRFAAWPAQLPCTLSECLAELTYWRDLSRLRHSFDGVGDAISEAFERECFVLRRLASIAPASTTEAIAVFDYLESERLLDQADATAILRNLIKGPRAAR